IRISGLAVPFLQSTSNIVVTVKVRRTLNLASLLTLRSRFSSSGTAHRGQEYLPYTGDLMSLKRRERGILRAQIQE
ncbi:MAG: hypothetical protein WCB53_21315, partial [Terriglobales bacterium]